MVLITIINKKYKTFPL